MSKKTPASPPPVPESSAILARVLAKTKADIAAAIAKRDVENDRRSVQGKKAKGPVNEQLSFSIYFGRHFGQAIADGLNPDFGGRVVSGENPMEAADGEKRVDVSYSRRQRGLGFMVSLKSVHQGERDGGRARFTHNMKRNDEELRVEATSLHLRQPYAVLVAVIVLPLFACEDGWRSPSHGTPTSSFARWVEKLWTLKGRTEPEDAPDRFEAVFFALYDSDSGALGFYELGGGEPCPRTGRPRVMSFAKFLERIRDCYSRRNERDFHFAGEARTSDVEEDGDNVDDE